MDTKMKSKIEKHIELKAPQSKVWQALIDYQKFGEWFRVKIDAPFEVGQKSTGHITYPGYEHLKWLATIEKIEPEHTFSLSWHPYACDTEKDYSDEPTTLVEFTLKPIDGGTLLTVVESGFEKLPADRRDEAFRMNEGGWEEQMLNIQKYVS